MSSLPSLRAVFLGSGSGGNATAISFGDTTVLVDCGFSAREVATRLRAAGIDPARVSAIFVTHEHSDHVGGIDVFVRRHAPGCIVHASGGTVRASKLASARFEVRSLIPGSPVSVGELNVVAFRTSHDAAEPVGYRIDAAGQALGIATDTGVLTRDALEALTDVDVLGIEGNHDVHMLEHGPYPPHLKRRILSTRGHLSNEDGARALARLASDRLREVVTLHRSDTNNTPQLVAGAFGRQLAQLGLDVPVHVAEQHSAHEVTRPASGRGSAPLR